MASAAKSKDNGFDCVPEFELNKLSLYEHLPVEIWESIFLQLKYEKICEIKLVCKAFNQIGKKLLEKGKSNVEKKLAQHLQFSKSQLLAVGDEKPYSLKYYLLFLAEKSLHSLFHLFREFIGKNEECFTLGKRIDFLTAFFVVLEDDELFDSQYLNFLRVLKFWRTTYDRDQMKQMGAFDFCVFMWFSIGSNTLMCCDPVKLLLQRAEWIHEWRHMAKHFVRKDSWDEIPAAYRTYKCTFRPDEVHELPFDYDPNNYYGDEEEEEDYGSVTLLTNEHWTPYEPPEMNKECVVLFRKYLYEHLKL